MQSNSEESPLLALPEKGGTPGTVNSNGALGSSFNTRGRANDDSMAPPTAAPATEAPVLTRTGATILLDNGMTAHEVEPGELDDRPFGDATRVLGTIPVDSNDASYDMARLLRAAAETYGEISFSISGGAPEQTLNFCDQVARSTCRDQEYKSFQQLNRSRVLQNTTRFSAVIEVLSRSGQTVKQSIPLVFPNLDGGYDEYRDSVLHRDKVDTRWWVDNQAYVMTKEAHLPSIAEKRRQADAMHARMQARHDDEGTQSDLPDDFLPYPRIMVDDAPDFGETVAMALQGSLETPIEFDDKLLMRVRVQGLQGTDGSEMTSRVFSGKDIREGMQNDFKKRKKLLASLQQRIDSRAPHIQHSVSHSKELCGGPCCDLFRTGGTPAPGEVRPVMTHLAMNGNRGQLKKMLTGIIVYHMFTRPARPPATAEMDLEVCATCLDDVQGEAWTCATCHKPQHLNCFAQWRRQCTSSNCVVTCPNCRAEVD